MLEIPTWNSKQVVLSTLFTGCILPEQMFKQFRGDFKTLESRARFLNRFNIEATILKLVLRSLRAFTRTRGKETPAKAVRLIRF